MICPLFSLGTRSLVEGKPYPFDCLQADCAWWDEDYERCSIRSIAKKLYYIEHNLLVASGHEPPPH